MSNPPSSNQWPDNEQQFTPSKSYALSGKIMLSSIIILFVVVIILVIFHLYARCYLRRRNQTRRRNRHNRSTRIVFYVDNNAVSPSASGGLDSNVLESLPVFLYSSENKTHTPECAVCLSEFEDGEKCRVLPKCKHSFHTECIDMWFFSNSTCPLCRSPVEPVVEPETTSLVFEPGSSGSVNETTSVADRRKGLIDIRIDVPGHNELVTDSEFRLNRIMSPSQGFRSPGSRLMSFTRMLTMNRRSPSGVGPSGLPVVSGSDIESVDESTRSNVK
ncbi:RING-H2 finger protein ATL2-like [Rutidosis leptorrhynchoides]|uniref:RING-H2 finger protein ATL2-like n=1 Tax=Rutidosis leptorrhynchoides TaxID=125765 RepID=UPI003A9950EB